MKKVKRMLSSLLCVAVVFSSVSVQAITAHGAGTGAKTLTLNMKSNVTMYRGSKKTIKVTGVSPKAASKKVTFKSNAPGVVKVSSKGIMKAVKTGKATITVTSSSNKKVSKRIKVTVKNPVRNVVENKVVIPLDKKKTLKLSLAVKASTLTFSSSKKNVAAVSAKGVIKAKKAGTSKITIKGKSGAVKGAKQTVTVYVAKKSVKSVSLNTTKKVLAPGKTFTLKTTVNPIQAANVVTFKSSKKSVATVSSKGKVKAVKAGTAKITVTTIDGKKKAVCTVVVTKKSSQNETTTKEEETTKTQETSINLKNPTKENGVVTYSCVYFGNYPQSDKTGVTKEPIKWRVLSVNGTDAYLLADSLLDTQKYNESYTNVTWKDCTIRSWLNGYGSSSNSSGVDYSKDNFIDVAFTAQEQKAIKTTEVVNGSGGSENTNDKVYLASIEDMLNTAYGFTDQYGVFTAAGDVARRRYTTEYVNVRKNLPNVNLVAGKKDSWWLRSTGANQSTAAYVYDWGSIEKNGAHVDNLFPVCPVLHLDLSKSECWSDAGKITINSSGTITVIKRE